jgi:hypothetical protein
MLVILPTEGGLGALLTEDTELIYEGKGQWEGGGL